MLPQRFPEVEWRERECSQPLTGPCERDGNGDAELELELVIVCENTGNED